jgi:uncharacterized protein (TIGR02246 family)
MTKFRPALATGMLLVTLCAGTPAIAQISTPSLQEVQDRLMIEDLMARYEWALDTGDADAYGALFTSDGVLVSGPRETKGRDAIAKEVRDLSARFRAAEKANADGTPTRPRKVIHSYSNVILDIKGNEATAKSNWIEVWNIRTGSPEVGGAGEYHDRLVKQNGKWQFQHREIRGTMSVARAAPAAAAAPKP